MKATFSIVLAPLVLFMLSILYGSVSATPVALKRPVSMTPHHKSDSSFKAASSTFGKILIISL
jgi:hypothetical protein